MQVCACTQRRFPGGFHGHIIDKTVDAHPQTAGSAGGCQHFPVGDAGNAQVAAQIVDCALQTDPDITGKDGGRRLSLSQKYRIWRIDVVKGVDNGSGRTDLRNQNINFHGTTSFCYL